MQGLLSIIIPVYNGEKYLKLLFKYLLENNYKNIEILVGDDASTDATRSILQEFEQNPLIKVYYSQKNIGAGELRNKLISMATGEFIAIQDADDTFMSDRFLKQINFLNLYPEVDVVGTCAVLSENGVKWSSITVPPWPKLTNWLKQNSVVHGSIMFRRRVLELKINYSKSIAGEDYFFLTQLYFKGVIFANICEELYIYNISRERLRSRSWRFFGTLMKMRITHAHLFPFYLQPVYLGYHISKLIVGAVLYKLKLR